MFRFIRDDEVLGWTVAPYFAYLASIEHRLDPALYAFVSDVDRYNLTSRKSLHDAWLRKLSLMPVDMHAFPSRMRLELEFLGPYHDRIFRLCYDDVLAYGLNQQVRTGHGAQDLLMHEFRLDEHGELLEHVFEFDDGLYLKVACQAMSFEEVMLEAEADDADRSDGCDAIAANGHQHEAGMNQTDAVWVFHGADARFASAVFRERSQAIDWIERHALSGVLTAYPLDLSVYDWALANGHFKPKSQAQSEARFIGAFSSAAQEHLHFENGRAD